LIPARAQALGVALALVVAVVPASAVPLPVATDPGVTRQHAAVFGTSRDLIATAPPASFRIALDDVPAGARLLTAIAVPDAVAGIAVPAGAAPLRFRIRFESDGVAAVLYERVLDVDDPRSRRWIDVGCDLAAFAGRRGTLAFETAPADEGAAAPAPPGWWAPPELAICPGDAPSLLLVTIDALRGDHLGSAGYGRPTTPHLDAFAADATRFAAAFAAGPKTVPSVPQILTGTYFYWHRPEPGLTALLGRDGVPSRAIVNNPYVAAWLRGEQPGFQAVTAGDLDARAITGAALRYLTAAGNCRTALYLHYLDTHTPYHAPPRWARRFVDRKATTTVGLAFDDVTGAWQDKYQGADRQRIVDLYDGSIAYTDRELGRLLRGLVRRHRLERTVVIVTADHGEELWDHRKFFHGQSLYDELLHVPLLVRLPDAGHGRVVEDVVGTVDVVPTIAAAMGRTPPGIDGVGLQPLAAGTAAAEGRTVFALVSHAEPRTPERQAARRKGLKVIRNVSDGSLEVYDLVADPKEKRNLGLAAPGAGELQQALDGFRARLDGKGHQLRLRSRAVGPVRYAVEVSSDPPIPLIAIDRVSLEPMDRIAFKARASAFSLTGTLEPGEQDQVRFDALAAVGVLKIAVTLDRIPAPDGTLRLGAHGKPAGTVVDLADADLAGEPAGVDVAPPPNGAPPVTVELWRALAPPIGVDHTTAPALDDAARERLRQLGYIE
jgi:arylsulfatase